MQINSSISCHWSESWSTGPRTRPRRGHSLDFDKHFLVGEAPDAGVGQRQLGISAIVAPAAGFEFPSNFMM
jgi:hypothetical protein